MGTIRSNEDRGEAESRVFRTRHAWLRTQV